MGRVGVGGQVTRQPIQGKREGGGGGSGGLSPAHRERAYLTERLAHGQRPGARRAEGGSVVSVGVGTGRKSRRRRPYWETRPGEKPPKGGPPPPKRLQPLHLPQLTAKCVWFQHLFYLTDDHTPTPWCVAAVTLLLPGSHLETPKSGRSSQK